MPQGEQGKKKAGAESCSEKQSPAPSNDGAGAKRPGTTLTAGSKKGIEMPVKILILSTSILVLSIVIGFFCDIIRTGSGQIISVRSVGAGEENNFLCRKCIFDKCSIVNETREIIERDKDATPAKSYKISVIEQI